MTISDFLQKYKIILFPIFWPIIFFHILPLFYIWAPAPEELCTSLNGIKYLKCFIPGSVKKLSTIYLPEFSDVPLATRYSSNFGIQILQFSAVFPTVAYKCKTKHNSENKITNYKRKCKYKKQNNNSETQWQIRNKITSQKTQWQIRKQNNKSENNNDKFENKITSQKTQRQIRQNRKRVGIVLRQRHWFGNRLLTADWTRHLSIKVQEEPQEAQQSL